MHLSAEDILLGRSGVVDKPPTEELWVQEQLWAEEVPLPHGPAGHTPVGGGT